MTAAAARLTRPLDEFFDEVEGGWRSVTEPFRASATGRALIEWVDGRVRAGAVVYPPEPLRALQLTPLEQVRAVIVGQDPYHGPGQAEGLAFSVASATRFPPSLRNLFKELQRDLGRAPPASGSLKAWAEQGVLLLNATLTVEDGRPASHAGHGWEVLTDALLSAVANSEGPTAYLLWGAAAQAKAQSGGVLREDSQHRIWRCNHPSPLSATRGPVPFMGCGHFRASAEFLARAGRSVDWCQLESANLGAGDS